MTTMTSRTLGISIDRDYDDVYGFLAAPENFAKWASGMDATAEVTTTPANEFGVLDHTVHLPDGQDVYVPLRAVRNGTGSEVLFTLFRLPQMDDAMFAADAEAVLKDLRVLKGLLESS